MVANGRHLLYWSWSWMMAEPSDARKSPVGRKFESMFFGGDCVIAVVMPSEKLAMTDGS